jgi:hypothetical protein
METMFVSTLTPFIIVGVFYIAYRVKLSLALQSIDDWKVNRKKVIKQKHRNSFYATLLLFTYFILPDITTKICQSLYCIDVDVNREDPSITDMERFRLASDLTVNCSSQSYFRYKIWAYVMFAVYPFGIPLLYFIVLWRFQGEIKYRNELLDIRRNPPFMIQLRRERYL